MNQIILENTQLPQILEAGYCCATEPFYHVNRTAVFHVLIFVIEGVIYVTEDNIDYAIKPGQIFFLKAGINHYGKIEIPQKTKWYYAHFLLNQDSMLENDISNDMQRAIPKQLSGLIGTDCEKDISNLINDFHSSNPALLWYTNLSLFKILSKLCEIETGTHQKKSSVADRIAEYIEAHYEEAFNIKKLEDTFCLSYKRLAAVFKEVKGTSMLKYCMEYRIQQACKLLQLTDLNISEIAAKVGYDDQLYFSRIFKQFQKISPKEWRRQAFQKYNT